LASASVQRRGGLRSELAGVRVAVFRPLAECARHDGVEGGRDVVTRRAQGGRRIGEVGADDLDVGVVRERWPTRERVEEDASEA
jgi:hypothetical protein